MLLVSCFLVLFACCSLASAVCSVLTRSRRSVSVHPPLLARVAHDLIWEIAKKAHLNAINKFRLLSSRKIDSPLSLLASFSSELLQRKSSNSSSSSSHNITTTAGNTESQVATRARALLITQCPKHRGAAGPTLSVDKQHKPLPVARAYSSVYF